MSELLDKQVNAQKENLKKYFRGSRELPQKVCDENESRNKEKKRRKIKAKTVLFFKPGVRWPQAGARLVS